MRARRRGSVVSIASVGSVAPASNGGAYAPAKADIVPLMQQFAVEWGTYGVRANAASPGMIRGGLAASFYSNPAVVKAR